ncbi:peptidoglycan-binding protein [Actinomadura atramentaria]|uniref:peptidoglycan-binding protein n=1 Tax=Actinomadura atramentaria TaxID=1990 RepID=UPI00037F5594|nr:peptidoglycan-binding protein [Actinomadura atramentaria]
MRTPARRAALGAAALAAVAGAAAAVPLLRGGDPAASRAAAAAPPPTAEVTRGDVVDTESVDGKLTYSGSRNVAAAPGTVTWTPKEGATVARGRPLLRVDDRPLVLMYGATPFYRTLRRGVPDGKDVRQLEANLQALGYGSDLTVDEEFTAATAAAVKEWQDDAGLPATGAVAPGQVVFLPAAVRVGTLRVAKGDRTGQGPAMTVTGTRPIVHVDLDAAKQRLARAGAPVTVELPGGGTAKGRIASVGRVAETTGRGDDKSSTVDVDIRLTGKPPRGLDAAPVSVALESARAKDVLSVPVEALLGLSEGGFGVEVVSGAARRIVPVTPGVYGGGRVEVSGPGLAAGTRVGVPES